MMTFIKDEPAFFYGMIQALITAALNVAVYFWADLSADGVAALNGLLLAVSALVLSLVTRSKVTPTANCAPNVDNSGQ